MAPIQLALGGLGALLERALAAACVGFLMVGRDSYDLQTAPLRDDGPGLPTVSSVSDRQPLVLSAEDDPDIQSLFRLALEHAGYRFVGACDGEDALAAARDEPPALFLLDLSMPRLSGIEVGRVLRADERFRDVPIVLLTASRSDAREAEAAAVGVTRYVVKPVLPNDLVRVVDDALGTRR